jgi:hypothetical protein
VRNVPCECEEMFLCPSCLLCMQCETAAEPHCDAEPHCITDWSDCWFCSREASLEARGM